VNFDEANSLWRDGALRLAAADPADRPALDRVTNALVEELRRRLGGPFTKRELLRFYEEEGTDWCLAVAIRVAPNAPAAWDMATAANAAFARYAREASDYRTQSARPPGMEAG
jgi:hypothetical protein